MSTNFEFNLESQQSKEPIGPNDSFIVDNSTDIYAEDTRYSHLTGATADPVKDYLRKIGKTPLLDAEGEVKLAKRIEAGLFAAHLLKKQFNGMDDGESNDILLSDDYAVTTEELEWLAGDGANAKENLIEANLRLVVSLAKRYTGRGMLFLDIIQEGNKGVIRAVEKFDYTKGYKFSTYATWWIRQSITRGMADQSRTIRIPVHMSEVISKRDRVERNIKQTLGRAATPEEIAKELEMTVEKVIEIQKYGRPPISINTPLGEGEGSEFGDLIEDTSAIAPAEAAEFAAMRTLLRDVLDSFFTEKEASVLTMRYGLVDGNPMTLDKVGEVYGVTRERIRQIESKAMARLRTSEFKKLLRDFLE